MDRRFRKATRFRQFVESIVFAGMRPASRSSGAAPAAKPGLLARYLGEPDPSDPLYLTNQTFGYKVRRILKIATPIFLVVAAVIAAVFIFHSKNSGAVTELTAAQVAAKVLPAFNHEIKLNSNTDLEVMEVHFENEGGNFMVGILKNLADHKLLEADVVFDLLDSNRSQLGGVTVTESDVLPGADREFKIPIEQTNAVYALVREIRTQ